MALSWLLGLFLPYLNVVFTVALTIVLAWLGAQIIGGLMRQGNPPMAARARQLTAGVVALIGGTFALQELGVNVDILLLVVGLLGATVLIALREPLANYGAKYFSDIYTPFKVGDTIQVQGVSGMVIEINAMTTVLFSEDDRLISVPNVSLIRDVVVNTTPQAWKEVTIPVSIGANVDLPTFESEALKSVSKIRSRLDARFPPVFATKARTPQSTDLVLTLMLRRPEDRDSISAEVNQRLSELLARPRSGLR